MNVSEMIHGFICDELMNGDSGRKIEETDPLIESGIIDSMGIMKLILYLEEAFKVKIEADDLIPENLGTIQAITTMIKRKTNISKG